MNKSCYFASMKERLFVYIIINLLFVINIAIVSGQTCCSGGVPLSGNVGLPSGEKGVLQILLNYDDNVLKTLKSGSTKLDDGSRTRHTRSIILQTGYSFTDKISVDIFSSFVIQERLIKQGVFEDKTVTRGVGDLALLLKYKWLSLGHDQHTTFSSALGVKFPLGASDLKNDNGISINADLQPGSGAWDGIFWTQAIHRLSIRPSSSISGTLIYNHKGTNRNYLGVFDYKFGNELQLHLGVGDRFILKKIILDPAMQIQYRYAGRDVQDSNELQSTGGQWLFMKLTNNLWFNQKYALHLGGVLPLYGNVDGTQLSPTYRLEIGVYFRFQTKKEKIGLY